MLLFLSCGTVSAFIKTKFSKIIHIHHKEKTLFGVLVERSSCPFHIIFICSCRNALFAFKAFRNKGETGYWCLSVFNCHREESNEDWGRLFMVGFFVVVVFFLNFIYRISISCWQFLCNVAFGVLDLLKDLWFLLLHSVGLICCFFIF